MQKSDLVLRGLFGLGLGLALSLNAPVSSAKDSDAASASKAKKKVLVGGFTGPKSGQARKAVVAALKDDGGYDVGETSEAKPGGDEKSYAAASAGASAVIVGTVKKTGLVISVHSGADGALVQDVEIKGDSPAKLKKNIADSAGLSLADAISQTKPGAAPPAGAAAAAAEAPAKGDDEDKDDEKAPAEEEKPAAAAEASGDTGPSPLELMAGLRAVHRSFTYHDTPSELYPGRPNLLKPPVYTLPLGPAVFIDGTIYPLAFGSRGAGAAFGVTAGYEINFGTKSVYGSPEQTLTTRANQYYAGLKGRIPISVHEVGITAAYGQQVFNLLGDENNAQVPDVHYKFFRFSAEGRFRFDDFSIGAHLGTRLVSNTGGLQRDWFSNVKTQSLEAGLSAGYKLLPSVELVCGFDILRYAFDFNPFPNDADPYTKVIAGGATDQYTSAFLGVRYSLPGHEGN